MKWHPAEELPEKGRDDKSAEHALCLACWSDGGTNVASGMFYDGKWQLDWVNEYDTDDVVVISWLSYTDLGLIFVEGKGYEIEKVAQG